MKTFVAIALAVAFAEGSGAPQRSAPFFMFAAGYRDSVAAASLSGIVLDSIHNEPLSGAKVAISGMTRAAFTDASGRFRIDSISPGVHDISVSHAFTDSIGIVMAAKSVSFASGKEAKAVFAVPSQRGINKTLCGQEGPPGNRAMLVGEVARVGPSTAASDATVELDWYDVSFQAGKGVTTEPRHMTAQVNAAGRYVFCNLNDSLDASVRAVSRHDSSGTITVSLAGSPVVIRYLYLPPVEVERGGSIPANRAVGMVAGRVIDADGRPMPEANIDVIGGMSATRSDANGQFQLSSARMGTQLLRVRRLGYEVSIQPVVIRSETSARVEVAMAKAAPALDPIIIRARLSDAAARSGFEFRARTGSGRYLTADQIQQRHAQCIFDVISFPRIDLVPSGGICSRELRVPNRGQSSLGGPASPLQSPLITCLDILVDDLPETLTGDPGSTVSSYDLGWLNPKSVVGVEMYSVGAAPLRFPHRSNCSLVLIWTSSFHGRHF